MTTHNPTNDAHREHLRGLGMTDAQIDAALDRMAEADPATADIDFTPGKFPADPVVIDQPERTWTCDLPPSQMLMSLNGFDEIAIASHFGERISTLRNDGITGGRALVFVHQRRVGMKDIAAFDYAMNLTMQETMDYFAPEPKDDDPASAEGNAPGAYM